MPPKVKSKAKKIEMTDNNTEANTLTIQDGNIEEEASNVNTDQEEVLTAIQTMRSDFSIQFCKAITSIQRIKEDINTFAERLTTAECHISEAEYNITLLKSKVTKSYSKMLALMAKVDKLENHYGLSNLRLVGSPRTQKMEMPYHFYRNGYLKFWASKTSQIQKSLNEPTGCLAAKMPNAPL